MRLRVCVGGRRDIGDAGFGNHFLVTDDDHPQCGIVNAHTFDPQIPQLTSVLD